MRKRVATRSRRRSRRRATGPCSNDHRMDMLEFAAALIAVERVGYERLQASSETLADWLISGFTASEWEFVQEQAGGNETFVLEALQRPTPQRLPTI
jgi:hypothetical protein